MTIPVDVYGINLPFSVLWPQKVGKRGQQGSKTFPHYATSPGAHKVLAHILQASAVWFATRWNIRLLFVVHPFRIVLFLSIHPKTSREKKHNDRRSVWTFKCPSKLSETDLRRSDLATRSSDSTSSIGGSKLRRCQLVRRRTNSLCVGLSIRPWSKCRHTRCRVRSFSSRTPIPNRISRA